MATVLIVDDSRAVRMLLARALRAIGYDTLEASNGREAVEILEHERSIVRLVLADWNMPEMNGLDLVKHVRQDPQFDALPIIMVTSESDMDQITAALAAGATEYVMKPFTREILEEKLELAGVLHGGRP